MRCSFAFQQRQTNRIYGQVYFTPTEEACLMIRFFSNLNVARKISSGFTLIFILMVIVCIIVYFSITAITQASRWVNHTYEVIRTAESVSAAMIDMETGQRGFMIKGKEIYLEPFNSGKNNVSHLIATGRDLTSDNPSQIARWDEVKALQEKWITEVADPEIAARRIVTQGHTANKYFTEVSSRTVGKNIFDNIRELLAALNTTLQNENNNQGSQLITRLTLDLVNMETGQRGYLLTGKDESLEPFVQGQASFRVHISQLKQLISRSSISQSDLQALENRVGDWITQAAQLEIDARRAMNEYPMTIEDIAIMMEQGNGKMYMDLIRGELKDIVAAEEVLIVVRGEEQVVASQLAKTASIIGTLIALIVGIVITRLIIIGIVKPIVHTILILKDIANGQGDLTKRLAVNSTDEIGQLSGHFNNFMSKLQSVITDVVRSANQLSVSAEQMSQVSAESNKGISQQNNETIQVATAITEMSSTIEEVARNTENATHAAINADHEAQSGSRFVDETMDSIKALAAEIDSSSEVLDTLKSHSEGIGTVLDVIKGIADQTNLLALNAAIEAARAGEQGRGFAVVADEVRTLAKRTQDSTSEIERIISDLQSGADQAVSVMQSSKAKSNTTVEKGQQTSEVLLSVITAINTVLDMNTQIGTAAQEQSAVTQEVSGNITNIQTISEKTALGADLANRASQEVANLSSELQRLVSQFKV
jgi:methyl-accepting chemotaxis protein